MNKLEFWKKLDDLKKHPELGNTPGYEVDALLQNANPVEWFLLLAEQPQFSPSDEWWFKLRNRCDLPWARLLSKQPQFEEKCHWESLSRLELLRLSFWSPEIYTRHFPKTDAWLQYPFLTPMEKAFLLSDFPELEVKIDWREIQQEFSVGDWMTLLSFQPQFEKYFDWSQIEGKTSPYWKSLLKRQPQFACHAPAK